MVTDTLPGTVYMEMLDKIEMIFFCSMIRVGGGGGINELLSSQSYSKNPDRAWVP